MAEISVSIHRDGSVVGEEIFHAELDDARTEFYVSLATILYLKTIGLTKDKRLRYAVRANLIRHLTKGEPCWYKSGTSNGKLGIIRLRV